MSNSSVIEAKVTPGRQMHLGGVLRIPAVRQVILLIGVAASVAAGFAVVLWSQTPEYAQLYGNLESGDTAEVAEALRAADIPFKLNTDTGSVSVPEGKLHDARLELASQGLPQGASSGMEVMNEQSSFGVSQFMESARYQHALETELARTIAHLGGVRDARVHLALPKQSAFIRDQRQSSASVLLQLNQGRELEAEQAAAIVHLVASSVQNLQAENVTLIDQNGRLLSSANSQWSDMQTLNQFKHAQRLEMIYKRRIEDLLTPLVGAGRVRAQVVADLDFTVTEETRESFDPARTVVRSEQISEERQSGSQLEAVGIPGALSNQPPVADVEPVAEGVEPDATETINSARTSTRNFEVDRTISHVKPQSGTIERLSVAVLIDDSPPPGAEGEAAKTLSEADIEQFTKLVKEAVGFDAERGDTVAVVNAAFRDTPQVAALEEPAFWEKPLMRDTLKQVLGAALVLILAFGLVRPMLRGLLTNNAASSTEFIASGGVLMPAGGTLPAGRTALEGPTFDEKVAAAKNITSHDPARVAQVVKKWVTRDE
ncbi:MAG TPA: flagellar basal-body MS-ring/collar protein FliF [Woeseiaceae bacterium]|nr:flagellar basal-body MS-ring/collar protein FliF [Woeseiaceae bacterium]